MRLKGAVILGSVLGLALAVVATGLLSARSPAVSPRDVYLRLREDAQKGDRSAREMLAAVDAYLSGNHLIVEDLGPPHDPATETRSIGPIQLRIESSAPWAISIRNFTSFNSETDLTAYLALREGALRLLASKTPERQLRLVVTPDRLIGVDDFLKALDCHCEATEIAVDVFVGNTWAFSSGRWLEGPVDAAAASQLLMEQAADAATLNLRGVAASDLRIFVRRISLTAPAADALVMSERPDVLLVDPLDDLADLYAGRAAFIGVQGAPEVFYGYARWRLGVTLDATSQAWNKAE